MGSIPPPILGWRLSGTGVPQEQFSGVVQSQDRMIVMSPPNLSFSVVSHIPIRRICALDQNPTACRVSAGM